MCYLFVSEKLVSAYSKFKSKQTCKQCLRTCTFSNLIFVWNMSDGVVTLVSSTSKFENVGGSENIDHYLVILFQESNNNIPRAPNKIWRLKQHALIIKLGAKQKLQASLYKCVW